MSPEVLLFAGYAGLARGGASRSSGSRRIRTGARCATARPASATTRRRTTGSAPRASTCGRTSSITSAGWCATARRPTSATAARARTPAPTPTAAARSSGRWTRGRTPRRAGSTAAVAACWWRWRCSCSSSQACATTSRPRRRCCRRCSRSPPLVGRWLLRDFRAHPANFPGADRRPRPRARRRPAPTGAGRRSRWASQNRTEDADA